VSSNIEDRCRRPSERALRLFHDQAVGVRSSSVATATDERDPMRSDEIELFTDYV